MNLPPLPKDLKTFKAMWNSAGKPDKHIRIYRLVRSGKSAAQVALILDTSISNVRASLSSIREKIGQYERYCSRSVTSNSVTAMLTQCPCCGWRLGDTKGKRR